MFNLICLKASEKRKGMDLTMNDAEKYQILILNKIILRLKKWDKRDKVFEKEIFLFLHKIIDAAHVIELVELCRIASNKLYYISEESTREWSKEKWRIFLEEIINYVKANPTYEKTIDAKQVDLDDNIILLIDNDFEFITHMKSELEDKGYHVIIALDAKKGLDVFYTVKPLFVLLNINLHDGKSLFDLKQFMEVAQSMFTPVAIVGDENVEENRIVAYSIGATDFISKPINLNVFIHYLQNRIEHRQRILDSITIDELTKTHNRKHMHQRLATAFKNFQERNEIFTIVMIDLDRFKNINDQYGHLVGDHVLEEISKIMKSKMTDKERIYRYGGEEFLIYLPGQSIDEAYQIIEDVRQEFNLYKFTVKERLFSVTFSAGLSIVNKDHTDVTEVIEQADQALLAAKKAGRNRTMYYSEQRTPQPNMLLNVIIIDDDRLMRIMLKDVFAKWQLEDYTKVSVQTFEDGEQFLTAQWYKEDENYLILLNGIMPKIDGIDVLSEIRREYPEENVVVSMLTSRSSEENIGIALLRGADDYMFKSLSVTEIMARSETLVKRMQP